MPSGGGGGTQVQSTDPWSVQQPYLEAGFRGAQEGILNQPGQGVVPFSPETQYSLYGTAQRALQGSPLVGMGQQQIAQTLGGDYMAGGPGFDAYSQAAWNAVRPGIDTGFAGGGRYGSQAHQEALGKGFGRAMAPLYESERGRQMQAAFGAPSMAMADYQDLGMLGGVGAAREQQAMRYADEPYTRLQRYMGLVGGGGYGGTQTTTGQGGSPMMGALGGGAMGAGAAGALGLSGPVGWGLAGAGALMGAFG